jgi:transposase InsO family protein
LIWSRFFDWKAALVVVKTATFIRWHRKGFKLYWRWKSRGGRPPLPTEIRQLIDRMVRENVTWGEERIADELSLKLGIWVSPRTVRKYWPRQPRDPGRGRASSQHWRTFVKNHAQGIVACDFLVAVTVRFRVLFVFVAMEVGSRRILHSNVTAHPTADWTLQQFREAIPGGQGYQFLIHDRDSIFSSELDEELSRSFRLRVLRTPVRAPKANAYCERLIGTMRRECLDFIIPMNERHLRKTLRSWMAHYNKGRPHSSLGPGIPERMPANTSSAAAPATSTAAQLSSVELRTFWAACITNIGWKTLLHDALRGFCGAQVIINVSAHLARPATFQTD